MGRKIEIKKIEDVTKCQVTYSKRRSSLMKKANELVVCCDVDLAFMAFSPSGRISKFSSQKRIEDVLMHYVDVPAEKRFNNINNVQGKLQKLRNLTDHIDGERSKLYHLDKQIENLELQIQKCSLELQILEGGLKDYEVDGEENPSLLQLLLCERNLKQSLERVVTRKNALDGKFPISYGQPSFQMDQTEVEGQLEIPFRSNSIKHNLNSVVEGPFVGLILNQVDPPGNLHSVGVWDNILQDFLDQVKWRTNDDTWLSNTVPNIPRPASAFAFPTMGSLINCDFKFLISSNAQTPSLPMSLEGSPMVDQTPFDMDDQSSFNAYDNVALVNFSDVICTPTQNLYNDNTRFTTMTPMMTTIDNDVNKPQFLNEGTEGDKQLHSSLSTNKEGQETGQLNKDLNNNFIGGSMESGNGDYEVDYEININEIYKSDRSQFAMFDDNFFSEDTFGDNILWPLKMKKTNFSEWEDLNLENF